MCFKPAQATMIVLCLSVGGCGTDTGSAGDGVGEIRVVDETQNGDPDAVSRQRWAVPSSGQTCLCFPNGDACALAGEPERGPEPEFRCPENEICNGVQAATLPNSYGFCMLPCFHPEVVDEPSAMDCAVGQECRMFTLTWGFEYQHRRKIAICINGYLGPTDD